MESAFVFLALLDITRKEVQTTKIASMDSFEKRTPKIYTGIQVGIPRKIYRFISLGFISILFLLELAGVVEAQNLKTSVEKTLDWPATQVEFMMRRSETRQRLEGCIASLELIEFARFTPTGEGVLFEMLINNPTSIEIRGLVVKPISSVLREIELDGAAVVEFEPIFPGGMAMYTERISKGVESFKKAHEISALVKDIVDEKNERIVDRIFFSNWPFASSIEELHLVIGEFC